MHKQLPLLFISFVPLLIIVSSFIQLQKLAFAAANHIVISEIKIAGTTADDEFVELFNPTDNAIDMAGYRLTKKTSSGTESNLVASLSGTINPSGYFLIAHPDYTGSSVPDKLYSAASNSLATNNSVTLYSDAGITPVDLAGWGDTTIAESTPTTNPPSSSSLERQANVDTDNNAADFALQTTPNPQNQSSQASPTPSPEPSPSPSPNPSPEPSPSLDPSPSPSPSLEQSPSPEPSPSPSPSPSPQPSSPNPSPTPSPSLEPSPSPEPSPDNILFTTRHLTCRLYFVPHPTRYYTLMVPRLSCERN